MSKVKIVVVSLFDGLSGGRIALSRVKGIKVKRYYSSEIKEHAIKVADLHFPEDTKHRLGDVTKINGKKLRKKIHKKFGRNIKILLIGGSPCQDFSGANKERLGVDGSKSSLFYEYVRIREDLNPDYFFLENVRMKKEHQDIVSYEMGTEPIVINSQTVAPHLRHRLYWTNIPQNGEIQSKDIKLNDILEEGYSDREKSRTLLESDSRPLSTPIKMVHRYFNTGFTTLIFKSEKHYNKVKVHFDEHFKGLSAKEIDEKVKYIDVSFYEGVRYMTNHEREACQTMPKGYTNTLTLNESACLLGDGWTIDVITHIFKGIINE